MNLPMERDFQLFSTSHNIAILMTVVTAIGVTCYARSGPDESSLKRLRYIMGGFLLAAVALDPILILIRYGIGGYGWEMVKDNALPFYLCDIVSILLAIALFKKNQRLAEIGYLWGLAGTTQGLIMPTLWFDWREMEFYAFFMEHGGAPIAAVFLVWGLGILPEKGAFRRAIYWNLGYLGIVMTINVIIGENYGFLNWKPHAKTFFDYMGPWPYYLISLQVIACILYALLLAIAPKPKNA